MKKALLLWSYVGFAATVIVVYGMFIWAGRYELDAPWIPYESQSVE